MTVYGNVVGLLDVAKRTGAKGEIITPIEMLEEACPVLRDAHVKPGNAPLAEKTKIRTGLGLVGIRRVNQGAAVSKSTVGEITDTFMSLEVDSEVDEKALIGTTEPAKVLLDEGNALFLQAGYTASYYIWYGNPLSGKDQIPGFSTRFGTLGERVLDAGGASNLCSIHLVVWGAESCTLFYPEASQAGVWRKPRPKIRVADANGAGQAGYWAHAETIGMDLGLAVKDSRQYGRIANIDLALVRSVSGTQALAAYTTNVWYLLTELTERIWQLGAGRAKLYMPRSLRAAMARQSQALRLTNGFTTEAIDGKRVTMFDGIEIEIDDQLDTDETAVS